MRWLRSSIFLLFVLIACTESNPVSNVNKTELSLSFAASKTQISQTEQILLSWQSSAKLPLEELECRLGFGSSTSALVFTVVTCSGSQTVTVSETTTFVLEASALNADKLSKSLIVERVEVNEPTPTFNQTPVVKGETYLAVLGRSLTVNVAEGVLKNDTDADGDALTAILVEDVSLGKLTLNADGSFSYETTASAAGLDFFTYLVSDGQANSSTVTAIITLRAPPVVQDEDYSLNAGALLIINEAEGVLANDSGSNLSAVLVSDVSHGTLSFNANGSFSYQHNANEAVLDQFAYKVLSDGVASETLTVDLFIQQEAESLSLQITNSADDTEELQSGGQPTGTMMPNSIDLDMGNDGAGDKLVGLRFENLNLTKDASFKRAYIQFQAVDTNASIGFPSINVYWVDEENPSTFGTRRRSLSRLDLEYLSTWSPETWELGAAGTAQQLDISDVLRRALNEDDWQSGNALALVLDATGSGVRIAESYDAKPEAAPKLIIEF